MNSSEIKTISISIDEWLKLIRSGVYSAARVTPTGSSMWPLIRSCKDQIEVIPIKRELKLGDIVVFKRADGRSVVHRVYKISADGQTVQTFGDNCVRPDAPVNISDVYGLVTKVFRDGKVIDVDCDKAREAINVYPKYAGVRSAVYGARSKANKNYKTIVWIILAIYAFCVLYLTFLCRKSGTAAQYNLEPLWEIKKFLDGDKAFGTYIMQNILLFIPIGFLAYAAIDNILIASAIGIGWSLIIEFSQLIFKRGLFETDDIMNNAIGTLIGVAASYVLARVVKKNKTRKIIIIICGVLAIGVAIAAKFKYNV